MTTHAHFPEPDKLVTRSTLSDNGASKLKLDSCQLGMKWKSVQVESWLPAIREFAREACFPCGTVGDVTCVSQQASSGAVVTSILGISTPELATPRAEIAFGSLGNSWDEQDVGGWQELSLIHI